MAAMTNRARDDATHSAAVFVKRRDRRAKGPASSPGATIAAANARTDIRDMHIQITESRAKTMARTLRDALAETPSPSHQQALEIVARQLGFAEFGAMKAAMANKPADADPAPAPTSETALQALAPFARAYDRDPDDDTEERLAGHAWESPEAMDVKVGDFKHARAVLQSIGRTDLLGPAGPRKVHLTPGDLSTMETNELCDLAVEVDLGRAILELSGLSRAEIEEIWLECDLLQERMEDPHDVETHGFAGMRERNDATLLADIALSGQLYRLAKTPAGGGASSQQTGGGSSRVHTDIQHPLDEIVWTVEMKPAPERIDSFISAARTAISKAPTLCAVSWEIDGGRVDDGWTGYDHALVPLDAEDVGQDAAAPLEAPAADGSLHAFCHDAGLTSGHLWVTWNMILWSSEDPQEVLERGGFVTALVPGATSPSALRSRVGDVENVLINTFLN
jgi:hypothetical protein